MSNDFRNIDRRLPLTGESLDSRGLYIHLSPTAMKQPPPMRERVDLIKKKLVRFEHEGRNRLLPKIFLDELVFKDLCNPWKDAIKVKLLGKNLGYNLMKEKLKKLWKLKWGFDIIDVHNGFYIVKYDLE